MSETSVLTADTPAEAPAERRRVEQQIVEIVSDSGEGAQKAGQSFGTVSAKMGNGVWTVEIIPAEIKPPARSRAGASGIRIRFGSRPITNGGDEADLAVAFNEQVLYGRLAQNAFKPGTVVLLENKWAEDPQDEVRAEYAAALEDFAAHGLRVVGIPLEKACQEVLPGTRFGKNMFVLGLLCEVYGRDLEKAREEIRFLFRKKGDKVVEVNQKLVEAGAEYARRHLDLAFERRITSVSASPRATSTGLGTVAWSMYVNPLTAATSSWTRSAARSISETSRQVVHDAASAVRVTPRAWPLMPPARASSASVVSEVSARPSAASRPTPWLSSQSPIASSRSPRSSSAATCNARVRDSRSRSCSACSAPACCSATA